MWYSCGSSSACFMEQKEGWRTALKHKTSKSLCANLALQTTAAASVKLPQEQSDPRIKDFP